MGKLIKSTYPIGYFLLSALHQVISLNNNFVVNTSITKHKYLDWAGGCLNYMAKAGKICMINAYVYCNTNITAAGSTLFTIPQGFNAPNTFAITFFDMNARAPVFGGLNSGGVPGSTTYQGIYSDEQLVAGRYYRFNMVWVCS